MRRVVRDARQAATADLTPLRSAKVVVKAQVPGLLHKSDRGGVVEVPNQRSAIVAAVAAMEQRFDRLRVTGYSLDEHVVHETDLGGELLLGMRWTPDFGAVVTFGAGGIYAEHLAGSLRPERGLAILSPTLHGRGTRGAGLAETLAGKAITPILTGGLRGRQARLPPPRLEHLLSRFLEFAGRALPDPIAELEINPLAVTDTGPVALDALVRLGGEAPPVAPERPADKILRLLEPRSLALVGVSRRLNPGHLILNNVLRAGFDRRRVYVVKPGLEAIEGCRCVADVASLPERVDLLVVAIDAARVPELVEEVIAGRKADSLILVTGGLGERRGSEGAAERLRSAIAGARRTQWRGPVVNGANCLGIRSRPGRYDTLFIPPHKLRLEGPGTRREPSALAVISQSGAFAIARASRTESLEPRYLVTLGNQLDLTVSDYLRHLKDDPAIDVFACYVEGFRPLDGLRFVEAAAELTAAGRPVILYRAGRTPAGRRASLSHTASLAGDDAVTRELARAAGVVVAETLEAFDDLVKTFCHLAERQAAGWRLGAISNAGFECVAIADNLGHFRLADLAEESRGRLRAILDVHRLGSIVEVGNPLDTTPILSDEAFTEAVRQVLEDPGVDAGIVGCVPLTGALDTLAADPAHGEDVERAGSVARRLAQLRDEVGKPWVAVVDGGPLYDPMARLLEHHGVPTFRSADRALKALETFCDWHLSVRAAQASATSP